MASTERATLAVAAVHAADRVRRPRRLTEERLGQGRAATTDAPWPDPQIIVNFRDARRHKVSIVTITGAARSRSNLRRFSTR
jgi:hypothetical protein